VTKTVKAIDFEQQLKKVETLTRQGNELVSDHYSPED
jgi:hypothetical protein